MTMNRKELAQRVRVMARMLKAKAPRLLRKHMGELETMLSSPKAPVKEVANAGLIPLVAKHLLSSDRKLAASAVHAIASITYKCSTSVMKAGCVSKLVELVCDEDGEIARNAIFALSNLAVDFQSQLLSNNALKQILWRLKQLGEPTNKKCWMLWADAMRLITNLVNITDKDDNHTKEMVKKTLKHKGDRQELIRVLKVSLSGRDQVDVVEDALRGILSLAKLHVCKHCGIPKLLDMEIIPLLTAQFNHSCYKIKKLAVDCIQDVVYNSVLDVSKCRPSPIQPLKELMHNQNQELSTCAALVLSNIACEGEQAIEALKAVGLFESMVSLLLNPHTSTELKTEAAWFVINVCGSGARRHLEEIVELGAVHGLSRWVLKQQKDTKMVEETVAALRSVCDMLLPKQDQITRYHAPQIEPHPDSNNDQVLKSSVSNSQHPPHAHGYSPRTAASSIAGGGAGASSSPGQDDAANGSEIKLQSMLPEDEAMDLVSSYVSAAKVLAHFEVSDGVYPSALETLDRIRNVNHAAKELLEGPLAGGSRAWLARLTGAQLEGILEHLTGRRLYDYDPRQQSLSQIDSKSDNSNANSIAALSVGDQKKRNLDMYKAISVPLQPAVRGEIAPRGAQGDAKAELSEPAKEVAVLSSGVVSETLAQRKEKLVAVMSHAIQSQLQGKLLAHYNQVRQCEREKQLHEQHGSIKWTVDVMHPSNIKQTKLTSNQFDCGDLKCHVLLYPWGNPNRPEAHKTHLSVYVAVLDIEKSATRKSNAEGAVNDKDETIPEEVPGGAAGADGLPGRFQLTIVNQADPSKSVSKGGKHTFTELASDRGFAQMIPLKELLQVGKGFIVGGKISIKAEITLSVSHSGGAAAASAPGPLTQIRPRKHNGRVSEGGALVPTEQVPLWREGAAAAPPPTHLSALVGGPGGEFNSTDHYIIVPAADRPRGTIKLRAGLKVDCRDKYGMWLEATILRVQPQKSLVHVHFNKWGDNWDQEISVEEGGIGRHFFGNFQTCSGPRPQNRAEIGAKCPNSDHQQHTNHHQTHRVSNTNRNAAPLYAEGDTGKLKFLHLQKSAK